MPNLNIFLLHLNDQIGPSFAETISIKFWVPKTLRLRLEENEKEEDLRRVADGSRVVALRPGGLFGGIRVTGKP